MGHICVITIGDFSGEGHKQANDYYVRCNKPRDEVRDAWFAAKAKLPECCPASFCSEFEDSALDSNTEALLRLHGAPMPADPARVFADDMFALTLWFLRLGDPELRFERIEAQPLMFCGLDAHGRQSDDIGYGCFSL